MTAYIDIFRFEYWDGPPPPVPTTKVEAQSRPGANGVSHTLLGKWGEPFEVVLTSFHANVANAQARYAQLLSIIGTSPSYIIWEGVLWSGEFGVMYNIENVELLQIQAAQYLAGPNISYSDGAKLVVRVTMTPQEV